MHGEQAAAADRTADYFELDGAGMSPAAAFAAWAAALPYYRVTALDDAFAVHARAWIATDVIVTDTSLSPVETVRPPALIAADRSDDIGIQLLLSGTYDGDADGRGFEVRPGDIAFLDISLPFRTVNAPMRLITVRLPQAALGVGAAGTDFHGLVLRAGEAPLLAGMLGALPAALARGRTPRGTLTALLCSHVALALGDAGVSTRPRRAEQRRMAIRRYLDARLAEPLDIPALCAALGLSRSAVYRLFADEGGLGAFVTRRRLARVHAALTDPRDNRPVREVAAAAGFRDQAHLSRLFRRTFGCTPGEMRNAPAQDGGGDDAAFRERLIARE